MPIIREVVTHEPATRLATVSAVQRPVPGIVRVTFTGSELVGFPSGGPTDHVKLYFTDPEVEGPTNRTVTRDYTAREFRNVDDGTGFGSTPELDIDFVIHEDSGSSGPASAWASNAAPGDQLRIAGPGKSKLVPTGASRVILVADESALPAVTRWLGLLTPEVQVTALLEVADAGVMPYFVATELAARASVTWLYRSDDTGQAPGQVLAALRALGAIGSDVYVFAAGEAGMLIPLRRYLRRELGLPVNQVAVNGYWKRGDELFDHHAPLDASDPD
jgi:NADPH-dependent ferric siderophore reductase